MYLEYLETKGYGTSRGDVTTMFCAFHIRRIFRVQAYSTKATVLPGITRRDVMASDVTMVFYDIPYCSPSGLEYHTIHTTSKYHTTILARVTLYLAGMTFLGDRVGAALLTAPVRIQTVNLNHHEAEGPQINKGVTPASAP